MNIQESINARRAPELNDMQDLAIRWNKYHLKNDGTALHNMMKPLVDGAIRSYGAGVPGLRVQAYKIAFDAIGTYNPEKGADIKTHIFNNLKRLNRVSAQRTNIAHVSENLARDYAMVAKSIANFNDEYGRDPNDDELSDITKLSTKKLDKILNRNTIISGSESVTAEGADRVYKKDNDINDYIEYLYASSDPVDKSIIEMSSGFRGKPIMQNTDIARKLKITPAAVSQRMEKLRERMSDLRGLV